MVKSRKKNGNNNGCTYYEKTYDCVCGYKFTSNNCRLVDKIKKLHKSRCTLGRNADTRYSDVNIDYNLSKIVETTSII